MFRTLSCHKEQLGTQPLSLSFDEGIYFFVARVSWFWRENLLALNEKIATENVGREGFGGIPRGNMDLWD